MRLLAAEITRERIYHLLHDELPYAISVETTDWKQLKDGSVRIEQTIFVERESQKKIVLGKGGRSIRQVSSEARQELQAEAQERIRERQEERLQNAIDNGIITEDEANQIREWWQNRPAALDKLRPLNHLRHHMQPGPMQEGPGSSGELPMQNSWQNQFQYQNQWQDT